MALDFVSWRQVFPLQKLQASLVPGRFQRVSHAYLRYILLLFLMQFVLQCAFGQQVRLFSEAKGRGNDASSYEYEKWSFTLGKDSYEIRKSGIGRRIAPGQRTTNFRVRLDKDE